MITTKKPAKKRGRPKLAKSEVKGRIMPVRFTDAELKLFTKAANASEHKTLSSWIRYSLREAATRWRLLP
jgi:hypothetical protein